MKFLNNNIKYYPTNNINMHKGHIQYRLKQKAIKRINAACIIQVAFRNTTQCAICLQLVQKSSIYCHTFHNNCREKWISLGNLTCPICRSTSLLSLIQKRQYFITSSNCLKQLKQYIEILDPNYFNKEEFKRWERKILLSTYYIDRIDNQLQNSKLPSYFNNTLNINNFNKIDMVIKHTNNLIKELTEELEELEEKFYL